MFDLTSLDQRYTEHERRVSRIDQDGWKRPSRVALVRSFRARLVETPLSCLGRLRLPVMTAGKVATAPTDRGATSSDSSPTVANVGADGPAIPV
jgi:hypothetical protein